MALAGQVCYSLLLLSPVHAGHREGQRSLRMCVCIHPTRVFHSHIPLVHFILPAWARMRIFLAELDIKSAARPFCMNHGPVRRQVKVP